MANQLLLRKKREELRVAEESLGSASPSSPTPPPTESCGGAPKCIPLTTCVFRSSAFRNRSLSPLASPLSSVRSSATTPTSNPSPVEPLAATCLYMSIRHSPRPDGIVFFFLSPGRQSQQPHMRPKIGLLLSACVASGLGACLLLLALPSCHPPTPFRTLTS